MSPLVHSRNVIVPEAELLPNVEELLEEARGFPNASHDDTIDAFSQAINRILLMPLLAEGDDVLSAEALYGEELDDVHSYLGGY